MTYRPNPTSGRERDVGRYLDQELRRVATSAATTRGGASLYLDSAASAPPARALTTVPQVFTDFDSAGPERAERGGVVADVAAGGFYVRRGGVWSISWALTGWDLDAGAVVLVAELVGAFGRSRFSKDTRAEAILFGSSIVRLPGDGELVGIALRCESGTTAWQTAEAQFQMIRVED